MTVLSHILRLLVTALLLLQMSLPFAQAHAVAKGANLADLICNPSGQAVSHEAEARLGALLDAIGEDEPAELPQDCDRCVTPHVALPVASVKLAQPTQFSRALHTRPTSETLQPISPRGPPCGKRAPPRFV